MEFEFGDVILVPFPFTDQRASKRRPAVVISGRQYNAERPDVIIMAITSQPTTGPFDARVAGWKEARFGCPFDGQARRDDHRENPHHQDPWETSRRRPRRTPARAVLDARTSVTHDLVERTGLFYVAGGDTLDFGFGEPTAPDETDTTDP